MIRIEAAYSPAPLTKLVEAKALLKAWTTGKSETAIRINKNIVAALLEHSLVFAEKPGFYRLTKKGIKVANSTEFVTVTIPLDLYLRFHNQDQLIKEFLQPKYNDLFKIMISTCFSCGEDVDEVEHILDIEGNEGSYCKQCLDKGYGLAVEEMKKRRADANSRKDS